MIKKSQVSVHLGVFLAILILALAAFGGYIANILKVVKLFNQEVGAELIIRGIGVVAPPLGAIAGYF